jgi:hypothetical protein
VGVMALAALIVLQIILEIVIRLVGTTSICSRVFALSEYAINLRPLSFASRTNKNNVYWHISKKRCRHHVP